MTRPMRWAAAAAALAAAGLALPGCTTPAPVEAPWVAQARGVAVAVPPKLLNVLRAEIDRSGPEGAIEVCRDEAPKMARAASEQSGWAVRRVSLRHRNPKAVPDAWERAALESFDRRAAAQAPTAPLERAEAVQENGQTVQRYIRALPVAELCTSCHGQPQDLSPAVRARLKALYPDDHGVGYRVGDIRGAITLRRVAP